MTTTNQMRKWFNDYNNGEISFSRLLELVNQTNSPTSGKRSDIIKSDWSLEKCFENLRRDPNYHLGMGDIRLTLGMQEEIINLVNQNK